MTMTMTNRNQIIGQKQANRKNNLRYLHFVRTISIFVYKRNIAKDYFVYYSLQYQYRITLCLAFAIYLLFL